MLRRRILRGLAAGVCLIASACSTGEADAQPPAGGAATAGERFRPAPYDGTRFSNLSGPSDRGLGDALWWMIVRQRNPWPESVANDPGPKPSQRVDDGTIRATFVGHATMLVQVDGLNILTDPMWSKTAGPRSWLGVERVRPPAVDFDDLPKIDVVLVSHNHYDHLDRPTLERLIRRDDPLILAGLKVGRTIPGGRVEELDWWRTRQLERGVRATFVPAEHFSARGPFDRNTQLWGGFVIETSAGAIYFAGDTGAGEHFALIRERFGPMALSLIPIGAYEPRWFMAPVHLAPEEALAASRVLESGVSLGIHFGTFRLADDDFDAPPRALAEALETARQAGAVGAGLDFRVPVHGRAVVVGAAR